MKAMKIIEGRLDGTRIRTEYKAVCHSPSMTGFAFVSQSNKKGDRKHSGKRDHLMGRESGIMAPSNHIIMIL